MTAPEHLADLPPAAREAVSTIAGAPTVSAKLLVSGGIGTGKSSVLGAIRTALRGAGRAVLTRPPRPGDPAEVAYVVDDAHLLDNDEIGRLTGELADPTSTVVVATEPLAHHRSLGMLMTALERENPVLQLGALPAPELHRILTAAAGAPAPPETVRSVLTATAGLPFLVRAVADSNAAPEDAARFALIERLHRMDERTRDALLITSLSLELGADDVAAALQLSGADGLALVDRARAGGLVEPSHDRGFPGLVHACLAQLAGAARHHDIETSLLRSQLELSTLSAELAVRLAEHGLRDDRLADALTEQATRVQGQPTRAARLYRAAAKAGSAALSARLADALALTGDCTTAGRMADELLGSEDPAERAAAVRIAASIAIHDGSAAQAADLFRWLGPYPDASVSSAGAIVSVAAGDLDAARSALSAERSGPPTSTARAAHSLADGLLRSLDQPFAATVARLGQSITAEQHAPGVAPDTPAALMTLTALHGGDSVRARSVIKRAVREGSDEASFSTHRHRLLLGWVRMQDGQLGAAAADASAADSGGGLHRRDALWAAALRTAIARRSGDSGAVQKHWYAAMEVLAEYSIDLFSLLPLGELWVAGARMREVDRLEHTLTEAFDLLEALGKPVLWSVPLHWAGVHAGILANSPEAVAPHGQALSAAAGSSAFARALAQAGRTWLRVLANQVDTDEVSTAARALSQFGLTWDGTRLASQAALHTPDARVSQAMLQLARDLKQTSAVDDALAPAVANPPVGAASAPSGSPARLSDREREVAELLLLGMPYRDIGSQLFISAKTVEHHVARIRRRLGAESRSEMLSMLRTMLESRS